MSPKRPKAKIALSKSAGERQPRTIPRSEGNDRRLTFPFQYADRSYDGMWASTDDAWEILDLLCEASRLTWGEVMSQMTGPAHRRRRKHHSYSLDSVCTAVQNRISELRLDEIFEELFRFRLSGEKRLWGFRTEDVFHVLWWDPYHQVYPTERN